MNKVMIIASACVSLLCYSLLLTVYGPHGIRAYELERMEMERLSRIEQEANETLSRLEDKLTKVSEDSEYRQGLGAYYGYTEEDTLTIFIPEESGEEQSKNGDHRGVGTAEEYESPLSTLSMIGLSLFAGVVTLSLFFLLRILKRKRMSTT